MRKYTLLIISILGLIFSTVVQAQDRSNDVLLIMKNRNAGDATHEDIRTDLQAMFSATSGFQNINVDLYAKLPLKLQSMLQAYYDTAYRAVLHTVLKRGYKYAVIGCDQSFTEDEPELYYEEVFLLSRILLEHGTIPIVGIEYYRINLGGQAAEHIYRVANGRPRPLLLKSAGSARLDKESSDNMRCVACHII